MTKEKPASNSLTVMTNIVLPNETNSLRNLLVENCFRRWIDARQLLRQDTAKDVWLRHLLIMFLSIIQYQKAVL